MQRLWPPTRLVLSQLSERTVFSSCFMFFSQCPFLSNFWMFLQVQCVIPCICLLKSSNITEGRGDSVPVVCPLELIRRRLTERLGVGTTCLKQFGCYSWSFLDLECYDAGAALITPFIAFAARQRDLQLAESWFDRLLAHSCCSDSDNFGYMSFGCSDSVDIQWNMYQRFGDGSIGVPVWSWSPFSVQYYIEHELHKGFGSVLVPMFVVSVIRVVVGIAVAARGSSSNRSSNQKHRIR